MMRSLILLLSVMALQFFGSKIGDIWFFIFVPFPLFFINKILSKKYGRKNVPYILFPVAFLLLDWTVYLPTNLASGMSLDVYFREFWETLMIAFLVGGIQWGMLKCFLFIDVLIGKHKEKR